MVVGVYYSDSQSTLHVPAGTCVRLFLYFYEMSGYAFKRCLCLNPEKAIHQVNKGSEVLTLV